MYFLYIQHKCASGWLNRVFNGAAKYEGIKMVTSDSFAGDYLSTGTYRQNNLCLISNADATKNIFDANSKGVHVFRDPRDILVSAYYSHKHSHETKEWPELVSHREQLINADIGDGLKLELDFSKQFFNILDTWTLNEPNILQIKMEEITKKPEVFANALDFFGWKKAKANSGVVFDQFTFEKLSGGRTPGQEDLSNHWRKGVAGDWKTHFDDKLKNAFKERYGDLVIRYGYEDDNDW